MNDCQHESAVLYVHGKNGSAAESERYRALFPNADVLGLEYRAETPWDARSEFADAASKLADSYRAVTLVAVSIGAYFSMHAGLDRFCSRAFFISPIVDMRRLILDMLQWSGATEAELQARGTIPTSFGETLSWDYLTWVRQNPISWRVPTAILYGSRDALQSRTSIERFAKQFDADVTVMEEGEHWFHTEDQLRFLDDWLKARVERE